jgi:putative ABC transport system permease protein
MLTDLRTAARSLGKSPGFSAVAIGILALGIGASTAIFSVVYGVLLKPLAYHDSARLVQVQSQHPEQGASVLAPASFIDLAREAKSFAAIAAQQYNYVNLTKTASPAQLTEVLATDNYFKLFGVAPLLGRTWNPDETVAGASPVAVLSEQLWRSQFNGRADIIGQTITLDDSGYTVIGVMPASFTDPWGNAALWRPLPMNGPAAQDRRARYWSTFARLKNDVTLEQAGAELAAFARQLEQDHPADHKGWTLQAADLQGLVVGNYRTGLFVVTGAVACVLLITCANVAGLSVVRSIGRRKELAVRAALGANRGHLLRQLLGESLMLALVGGGLGILVAHWGVSGIIGLFSDGWLPRSAEIAINQPVLLAALVLTLVTGVAFGLVPAWNASRVDANDALKDGGRGSAGPASRRLRSGLVIVELALALVLLVAAGLLGRSFGAILRQPPGMQVDRLLALNVSLSAKRYDTVEKRRDFYQRVEQAIAAVPGVASGGFTQTMPFTWGIPITLIPVGQSNVNEQNVAQVFYDSVSVDFFKSAGIPLLAGRTFAGADDPKAPGVVVISAAAAKMYFGDENPVGRRLRSTNAAQPTEFEIVGVVGDVLRTGLGQSQPPMQVYRPILQRPTAFATLLVRTDVRPDSLAKSVQRAVWSVDPDQAIGSVNPVARLVSNSTTQARLYLVLFGLFAGLALLLSAIGLYGLIAYGVAQRTREFGIRTALGATSREVLALVLREGALLVGLGLGIGLIGAFAAARLLRQMVFETSIYDPMVFAVVPLMLALTAAAACLIPARRATRVDPITALRAE